MHPLESSVAKAWPPEVWRNTRLLVGVSGGADSVALLLALLKVAEDPSMVHAAHYNHRWRGAESDDDAQFVRDLCTSLNCQLHTGVADDDSEKDRRKSEENARKQRYQFLSQAAYRAGCRYISTAHTASDRIETLLHNLFRGTGLAGVASPQLTRPLDEELVLVRPLLGCSREQVIDYLQQRGQSFRTDSTNSDLAFRRNYIRRELLPVIRQQYGDAVDQKLLSFSELAEEANEVFRQYAIDYLAETECLLTRAIERGQFVSSPPHDTVLLPAFSVLQKPWPIVREALAIEFLNKKWPLQAFNRGHWNKLRDLMEQGSVRADVSVEFPGQIRATRSNDWLALRKN